MEPWQLMGEALSTSNQREH